MEKIEYLGKIKKKLRNNVSIRSKNEAIHCFCKKIQHVFCECGTKIVNNPKRKKRKSVTFQ